MFSERFVDPRLCDASQLVPVRPHDEASDWFAFAVDGVPLACSASARGAASPAACTGAARALRRLSACSPRTSSYPRAARRSRLLPDDLLDAVPRDLRARPARRHSRAQSSSACRFRRCTTCGDEHARLRCPACTTTVAPTAVHGRLRTQTLYHSSHSHPRSPQTIRALGADALSFRSFGGGATCGLARRRRAHARRPAVGPERIGSVLAGADPRLGAAPSSASASTAPAATRSASCSGPIAAVSTIASRCRRYAASSSTPARRSRDDRAWLWLTLARGRPPRHARASSIDARRARARDRARSTRRGSPASPVRARSGPHLFVPTDDGIARIEVVQRDHRADPHASPRPRRSSARPTGSAFTPAGLDVIRRPRRHSHAAHLRRIAT